MRSAFVAAPPELLIDNDSGRNNTLETIRAQYVAKAQYLEALDKPSGPLKKGTRPTGRYYYWRAANNLIPIMLPQEVVLEIIAAA